MDRVAVAANVIGILCACAGPLVAGLYKEYHQIVAMMLAGLIPAALSCAWLYVLRRNTLTLLNEHDFLLCTQCRYALDRVKDSTPVVCPECGMEFEHKRAVQDAWRRWGWM